MNTQIWKDSFELIMGYTYQLNDLKIIQHFFKALKKLLRSRSALYMNLLEPSRYLLTQSEQWKHKNNL